MTVDATYNTPASEWTWAIDAALADWSAYIDADAHWTITLAFDTSMVGFLAKCMPFDTVSLGYKNGAQVKMPLAAARLQGHASGYPDFTITINPSHPFSFGANAESEKYHAISVLMHEVFHGFCMISLLSGMGVCTLFDILKLDAPHLYHEHHFMGGTPALMTVPLPKGAVQGITSRDLDVAAACGVPIKGRPRTVHVLPGQAGASGAKAVWWGAFSSMPQLGVCGEVSLPGDNPLSANEAALFKLYRAAMGRVPDLGGFRYWLATGKSLVELAAIFVTTPEFAPTTALAADRIAYVTQLYRNILGRDPEPSGLIYWVNRTNLDAAGLLANIAYADENRIGVPRLTL